MLGGAESMASVSTGVLVGGVESMASVSTGAGRSRKYGLCKYWCWEEQKVWPL